MFKKAIVLVNIGTPEVLSIKAVKKYLKKFLMDKNVIDLPFLARFFLVRGVIVPFRALKSLNAYKVIWKKEGSPLDVYTKEIVKELTKEYQGEYLVRYAMSYSAPYINKTLDKLKEKGVKEVYYIPMYPQYAQSSSLSALEEAEKWAKKNTDIQIKSRAYYFNHLDFLNTSVEKIKNYKDKDIKVLFSFHGIPEKHLKKIHKECNNCNKCCLVWHKANKFCYRAQCFKTASDISNRLGLWDWEVSFQSRLGTNQWILPYTVDKVKELARKGIKRLIMVPYAFTVDCLETEEEIDFRIKEVFIKAGGKSIIRVPCLNKDFKKLVTSQFLNDLKPLKMVLYEIRSAE